MTPATQTIHLLQPIIKISSLQNDEYDFNSSDGLAHEFLL